MKHTSFSSEWKAVFRNKKLLIPLIAVMLIPVLYSGMFLWAFWDPYDRLQDLPVAIVNNDKGAVFEGEKLQLGDELIKKLKDNDQFSFHFVDEIRGYEDLKAEKYYMLVEIPETFSENATTLLDDKPKKLELKYVPNESFNFLSAQIGETAVKEIKSAVSKEVIATYSETMFDKVKEMADGFALASDGASKLDEGVGKLSDGSKRLKENLDNLASKSIEFQNGVSKVQAGTDELAAGTSKLANGLDQLANGHGQLLNGVETAKDGTQKLAEGANEIQSGLWKADSSMGEIIGGTAKIQDGAATLANKLAEFQTGARQVAQGANQLHAGVQEMKNQLSEIDAVIAGLPLPDEVKAQLGNQLKSKLEESISQLEAGSGNLAAGTEELQTSVGELHNGASSLSNRIKELNSGQKELKAGLAELTSGTATLTDGANKLAAGQTGLANGMTLFNQKLKEAKSGARELNDGASKLNGGMSELADGSGKLSDGSRQLADGSTELADGTQKLREGTSEMKEKLGEAANKAGTVHATGDTYDMMGEPVKVENKAINKVPNYGTGFAPYFLSHGLFVGALLLSIVFPLREPATRAKNGFSWFIGKFGVIAIVGVLQSLIAVVIMLFGLGIEVQSVPLFILTTIITSLSFIALIQFLVTMFGDPGRFIAIIVLILQLTTSAGTFPLELIPHQLQPFNTALPMTYSVRAYKSVISSGDFTFMWKNLGILSAYLVGFMMMTLGFFHYKHKKQFEMQAEM